MLNVKHMYQGVIIRTPYSKKGQAKTGDHFTTYRALADEASNRWLDLYVFGDEAVLAVLPQKLLVRGNVSVLNLPQTQELPGKTILGANALSLEVWDREKGKWTKMAAFIAGLAAKAEAEEEIELEF
jgi:hypothetical protein